MFEKIPTTFIFILLLMLGAHSLPAQEAEDEKRATQTKPVGFVDENHDGINDRFQDANGDGMNDVDDKPYPHPFKFSDKDKDGLNDTWTDMDGDGVNDLYHDFEDEKDRKAPAKCVLDVDGDGMNDITGIKFDTEDFSGHKYGFLDERTGKVQGNLIDENGNGLDDRIERARLSYRARHRDYFVDMDGDGICDGRGDELKHRHRGGDRKGHGGKH